MGRSRDSAPNPPAAHGRREYGRFEYHIAMTPQPVNSSRMSQIHIQPTILPTRDGHPVFRVLEE
jgi:hypothetical protein